MTSTATWSLPNHHSVPVRVPSMKPKVSREGAEGTRDVDVEVATLLVAAVIAGDARDHESGGD